MSLTSSVCGLQTCGRAHPVRLDVPVDVGHVRGVGVPVDVRRTTDSELDHAERLRRQMLLRATFGSHFGYDQVHLDAGLDQGAFAQAMGGVAAGVVRPKHPHVHSLPTRSTKSLKSFPFHPVVDTLWLRPPSCRLAASPAGLAG